MENDTQKVFTLTGFDWIICNRMNATWYYKAKTHEDLKMAKALNDSMLRKLSSRARPVLLTDITSASGIRHMAGGRETLCVSPYRKKFLWHLML